MCSSSDAFQLLVQEKVFLAFLVESRDVRKEFHDVPRFLANATRDILAVLRGVMVFVLLDPPLVLQEFFDG